MINSLTRERNSIKTKAITNSIKIVIIFVTIYSRISMVEIKGNGAGEANLGKKRILPTEISHKFSSKDDFLNFFSKQVGAYYF